jgi:secreted trypsin-like serine protease
MSWSTSYLYLSVKICNIISVEVPILVLILILIIYRCDLELVNGQQLPTTIFVGLQQQENVTVTATNKTSNIIDGTRVGFGQYPAFVSISGVGCGGTLIHSDIVLTAGHCVGSNVDATKFGPIYIGSTKRDGSDAIEVHEVTTARRHPYYTIRYFSDTLTSSVNISYLVGQADYDYALLKLSKLSTIQPMLYNMNASLPFDNDELITMGYGNTQQEGYHPSYNLLKVTVNAINTTKCYQQYNREIDIPSSLCAAAIGKDSCNGDSGGPLLLPSSSSSTTINGNDMPVVVGIVSGGIGCAIQQFPGIYSRISTVANDFIFNSICELSNIPPSNCPYTNGTNGNTTTIDNNNTNTNTCTRCTIITDRPFFGSTQLFRTMGVQLYKGKQSTNTCQQQCYSIWSTFIWKLFGWKCGTSCPY